MKELQRHIMFNYVHDRRLVLRMLRHVSMVTLSNIAHCLDHGGIQYFPVFKGKQERKTYARFTDYGMVLSLYKMVVALDLPDEVNIIVKIKPFYDY